MCLHVNAWQGQYLHNIQINFHVHFKNLSVNSRCWEEATFRKPTNMANSLHQQIAQRVTIWVHVKQSFNPISEFRGVSLNKGNSQLFHQGAKARPLPLPLTPILISCSPTSKSPKGIIYVIANTSQQSVSKVKVSTLSLVHHTITPSKEQLLTGRIMHPPHWGCGWGDLWNTNTRIAVFFSFIFFFFLFCSTIQAQQSLLLSDSSSILIPWDEKLSQSVWFLELL